MVDIPWPLLLLLQLLLLRPRPSGGNQGRGPAGST
jgi:hypothetical protein